MIKHFLKLACITFALFVAPLDAALVYGYGNDSCGTWIKEHAQQSKHSRYQTTWVLGYISGSDFHIEINGGKQKATDANAVISYIDKYCRENPLKEVYYAAQQLVNELSSK